MKRRAVESQALEKTEAWYMQYGEAVFHRCQRILSHEHRAWDATQEVFLKAHRHADSLHNPSAALSWLLTIANRTCFSFLRRSAVKLPHVPLEIAAEITDTAPHEAMDKVLVDNNLVQSLLVHFSDDIRQIVMLHFFDELGLDEIADQLDISAKTVRRKLDRFYARARSLLTKALGQKGFSE